MAEMSVPGNIHPEISSKEVPILVIHGKEDPFNSVEAGKEIASIIPEGELLLIDDMGHSFPREILGQILDAISANSNKIKSH